MSAKHDDQKPLKPGEVPTTGHSWDGIEELDNPMPRWWLYTWYACIIWAIGYSICYPAWPLVNQATQGILGYKRHEALASEQTRFAEMNAPIRAKLVETELTEIPNDPELMGFATQAGASVFKTWCAQCHGSGAAGVQAGGYPSLLDDDWLWGGTLDDIVTTVTHGIRNTTDEEARISEMPAFKEQLSEEEITQVVQFVRMLSGQEHDMALLGDGETIFADNCAACHGEEGTGEQAMGAPNLTDAIWLYGGDVATITKTVTGGRKGVMPNWNTRLSESDIRAVALYVHGLGGGQ